MPVREKAVTVALRSMLGGTPMMFYNHPLNPTATIGEELMSRDEFNRRFWEPIEFAYERVVDSIDWKRVLLEASARHIALDHDDGDYGLVCPECVCEALMADETHNDWVRNPIAPRYSKESSP